MESMDLNRGFWRNRRVFITGHTGFKGSWLALLLNEMGAVVTGYALPAPTKRSLFELARVADSLQSISGDVRDIGQLRAAIRESAPQIVIHLAAQSLVRHSYDDPQGTFSTNVDGTVNLLEACRDEPFLRAVLVVTTDKCYEEDVSRLPYTETDPLGGHDPYSASKACAEIVTAAYRRSFFSEDKSQTAVASARAGNVIGGGDWAVDRLVPDLIRAFATGQKPTLRNPAATRPWQHVLDPLRGYLLLAERLHTEGERFAEAWNFGPSLNSNADVRTVADSIANLWGSGASWSVGVGSQPREAPLLALDSSKARQRLAWKPQFDLDATLAKTVSWYKKWHHGGDARKLVCEQINDYLKNTQS